jgi:hypothetical protein
MNTLSVTGFASLHGIPVSPTTDRLESEEPMVHLLQTLDVWPLY